MLSVEEAPVVSVPVVAPDNWFKEPAATAAPTPAPARFLSEDEEKETADSDAAFFFASSTPAVATTVSAAAPPTREELEDATVVEPEPEPVEPPARPRFAEMLEEPAISPQPRDYAAEFGSAERQPDEAQQNPIQPTSKLFTEPGIEEARDLDIPAIMRRVRF